MAAEKITPEEVAKRLGLPASAIGQLKQGEVVTQENDASNDKDLSLIVAALLNNSVDAIWEYVNAERVQEIQDAMVAVGELDPNNIAAGLEKMELTEDMVKGLLKNPFLSKKETQRVKDGSKHGKGAQVYKEVLAERAEAYWKKGLKGIEPYEGKGRAPGTDLKAATDAALKILENPIARQEIQAIPSQSTHPEKHKLLWGIQKGNDLAAPILEHKVRIKFPHSIITVSNQFYSGCDKDALQILTGVLGTPEGDDKCILFYVNHTYSPAVAGFGGGAKRSIGRKIMKGKLMETFKKGQALKL